MKGCIPSITLPSIASFYHFLLSLPQVSYWLHTFYHTSFYHTSFYHTSFYHFLLSLPSITSFYHSLPSITSFHTGCIPSITSFYHSLPSITSFHTGCIPSIASFHTGCMCFHCSGILNKVVVLDDGNPGVSVIDLQLTNTCMQWTAIHDCIEKN